MQPFLSRSACGPGRVTLAALRRTARYYLDQVPGGPREVNRIIGEGCDCPTAPVAPGPWGSEGPRRRLSARCRACWGAVCDNRFEGICAPCRLAVCLEIVQGRFSTGLEILGDELAAKAYARKGTA